MEGLGKAFFKKKSTKILAVVITIIIGVAVWILITSMNRSIDNSLYVERKELLGRLTDSSADIVNYNLESVQSILDLICDNSQMYIPRYTNINAYITRVNRMPGYGNKIFFFVDKAGKYYCSDGATGKIADSRYYSDSSDATLSYISTLPHLDPEKNYLILRNRLSEPVPVKVGGLVTELMYCGLLFDFDNLNEFIAKEFPGKNNSFIYNDTNGVMMYKNFGLGLVMNGFNIYTKLSACNILFGATAEEIEQACRAGTQIVAAIRINNEEYYFCSAPLDKKGWSIAFIVKESYFGEVSGNAFSKIVLYIGLIAGLLGLTVTLVIGLSYKNIYSTKTLNKMTELNGELELATKAKSDFLSNMSHDIRTPINGIMGMVTIARGVPNNPEKTQRCLNKINEASQHLLSLINDVLDMSRIERGKTEIAAVPIDICAVCENCVNIIKGQLSGRKLEVISEFECGHPRLIGDDLHLRQVFINILGNAVKFTKDGGKIWFRCKTVSNAENTLTLAFEIEDTGVGMKKEFLNKLFDPFSQEDGGARSEYKGTGLGMAITKQLLELMKGTIAVESEPDKGSKFTVTVPFTIDTSAVEQKQEDECCANAENLNGIKLLLVEDNELNMEIAVELLEEAGAILTRATDGRQALELFKASMPGTFDCILMDVMMPVMNGLEATEAIRALPRDDARTIPILAMTANAFESDIKATQEAGMNAHLSKPININEVIKNVAYHVKKTRGAK